MPIFASTPSKPPKKRSKPFILPIGHEIPRTHDLAFLMDNLPEDTVFPPAILALPTLNKFAVQYRYPGQDLPVAQRDWLKAIALTRETLHWAERILARLRRTSSQTK